MCRLQGTIAVAIVACLLVVSPAAAPPAHGGDGKSIKELGGSGETPVIELMLGETPELSFFLWSGRGIVLARVSVEPADKPETYRARIVSFARLWKDKKKASYEFRRTPQILSVPFNDENGNRWTLTDGSSWEIHEVFVISKKNLLDRVKAVPEYKPDGRPWYAVLGATNALDAASAALDAANTAAKIAELAGPALKKKK